MAYIYVQVLEDWRRTKARGGCVDGENRSRRKSCHDIADRDERINKAMSISGGYVSYSIAVRMLEVFGKVFAELGEIGGTVGRSGILE